MADQNLQALAQAIGENSQVLMQNAHTTDQNTRALTECAGRIANILEELSFGDIMGPGIGEGKIPLNIKFWFDICFTALQHSLGHFRRGQFP